MSELQRVTHICALALAAAVFVSMAAAQTAPDVYNTTNSQTNDPL